MVNLTMKSTDVYTKLLHHIHFSPMSEQDIEGLRQPVIESAQANPENSGDPVS